MEAFCVRAYVGSDDNLLLLYVVEIMWSKEFLRRKMKFFYGVRSCQLPLSFGMIIFLVYRMK